MAHHGRVGKSGDNHAELPRYDGQSEVMMRE